MALENAPSCSKIVWKVGPFVDGELPSAEREEVASHLAACKDCSALALDFRKLDDVAARDKVPPVSGGEWASVLEGVLALSDSQARPDARDGQIVDFARHAGLRRWSLLAVAAAAIFLMGTFVGWKYLERLGPGVPRSPVVVIPAPSPKQSEVGEYAEILRSPPEEKTPHPGTDGGTEPKIDVDQDSTRIHYKDF